MVMDIQNCLVERVDMMDNIIKTEKIKGCSTTGSLNEKVI